VGLSANRWSSALAILAAVNSRKGVNEDSNSSRKSLIRLGTKLGALRDSCPAAGIRSAPAKTARSGRTPRPERVKGLGANFALD
jgi:hypothetical protein